MIPKDYTVTRRYRGLTIAEEGGRFWVFDTDDTRWSSDFHSSDRAMREIEFMLRADDDLDG